MSLQALLCDVGINSFYESSHSVVVKPRKQKRAKHSLAALNSFAVSHIVEENAHFVKISIPGHKPYVCTFQNCLKSFNRRSDLLVHLRFHTGEKPFCCKWPECEARFTQSGTLRVHERKHTGEKPFPCVWPDCKQRCLTRSDLKKHERTHTGEKPYICSWPGCDQKFTESGTLSAHRRKHAVNKKADREQRPPGGHGRGGGKGRRASHGAATSSDMGLHHKCNEFCQRHAALPDPGFVMLFTEGTHMPLPQSTT